MCPVLHHQPELWRLREPSRRSRVGNRQREGQSCRRERRRRGFGIFHHLRSNASGGKLYTSPAMGMSLKHRHRSSNATRASLAVQRRCTPPSVQSASLTTAYPWQIAPSLDVRTMALNVIPDVVRRENSLQLPGRHAEQELSRAGVPPRLLLDEAIRVVRAPTSLLRPLCTLSRYHGSWWVISGVRSRSTPKVSPTPNPIYPRSSRNTGCKSAFGVRPSHQIALYRSC